MRIFVDARIGWGSGIGRYVSNTVPLVAALRPDIQFDAIVAPIDRESAEFAFAGVPNAKIIPCEIEPFSAREQWALEPLARGYDLAWFTNYWVPLRWSGRYVATIHDLLHLRTDLFPASPAKRAASWATFRKLGRSAAGLSFGSRFSQREFETRFGPAKRSRVHYYGIDHRAWIPFDIANPPAKTRQVLAVGASKMHKNFDVIVDAWSRADLPDGWKLTIISPDAPLRSGINLEALVSGRGRVEIRRGISNDDLRTLYGESAILLMPSLYEGFGLPLMEAMQAGVFCVASTADSMVEISEGAFVQFVNGRDRDGWVEAIERSCRMMDSPDFNFADIQRHNMIHAANFTWQKVAETTAALLNEII